MSKHATNIILIHSSRAQIVHNDSVRPFDRPESEVFVEFPGLQFACILNFPNNERISSIHLQSQRFLD